MPTHVYTITALTNLHVGSGNAGYGIVDKLVQRDPATNFPTIHMSGIKGALRQYFREMNSEHIRSIFGSEVTDNAEKIQQGKIRFISADLLALPRPYKGTENHRPYDIISSQGVAEAFDEKVSFFTDWNNWALARVRGEDWVADTKDFSKLAKELPVVARNYLENGTSKNLWYEEFVPQQSVFGTILQGSAEHLDIVANAIEGKVVQLGANATVGYGYCLFTRVNP